jgi:chemotaxis protein methyltransferase CheR
MEASLSKNDFSKLSSIIYKQSGIKMPDTKRIMVEARLRKRLRDLNINTYSEYCEFLFSEEGRESEIINMVDVITTNKTDFFREPKQFTFLENIALPGLAAENDVGFHRPLRVWSAGCSSGEEPFTISMVLNEFQSRNRSYSFYILATDISTIMLEKANSGIYEEEKVEPIPPALLKKYFLKSKDRQKKLVRVIPSIRNSVNFRRLNFMEDDFGIRDSFDIIFCRNVIIYFDKLTQENLISKLLKHLNPGGYLFLGHSESIFDTRMPVCQMAASTYKKVL